MAIKKIYLELTNQCNLNCTMCYRQSWTEKPVDMDRALYEKVKKESFGIETLQAVVLGGIGEPTCAPLIADAMNDFTAYDLTLTTNGVRMDRSLKEFIVKHVNKVMISIDGLYDNFLKIRGTNLEEVIQNIRDLNEFKQSAKSSTPHLGIQIVLSKDNITDLFPVIDLAVSLNVNTLIFSNLLPQTKENADKILYKKYDNQEMKTLFVKAVNHAFTKGIHIILPHVELKTERRCSFIEEDAVFIDASGKVVPCYRLSHSYREYVFGREKQVYQHAFGNLNHTSLTEIWNSKSYSSFRDSIRNNRYPSCMDCDYAEGCDMVKDSTTDCHAGMPSCADCLWARRFAICP